jgi:hypothetical protein
MAAFWRPLLYPIKLILQDWEGKQPKSIPLRMWELGGLGA